MASQYSSLKIQLMATGENSGTWGNVTNVNLGTALEEAIVGSADVAFFSANVTLTLTDSNSSQTARNLRLNLTGTTGGARDLIVPAIEKVYIVNNGCADTITIKNASGTGISVPPGKTEFVYNNGTNVVEAINHLTSLTLDTALPITSGGTGTNSTTFANLQSNVTGVLPIANGGTGTNVTTYANLQSNVTGILPNANTTATDANGASTIVARDASGNFTANVITANGSALTSLNATSISSGTLAVGNGGTGINAVGTAGNLLTSNGTAWVSQAATSGFTGATINAPSASVLTLTNTSTQCQIVQFTSVANSIVNLPNATTLTTKGAPIYRIINDSQCSSAIFIRNASGTLLATLPVKYIVDITLEDNTTSAGSWVFSGMFYESTPTTFESASQTSTTVSLGTTPLNTPIGVYGIQLTDTSYIFGWLQAQAGSNGINLRAVGATLSGNTFTFGTPANSSIMTSNAQSYSPYIGGFRLNSTTAIFDCRNYYDDSSLYLGQTHSVVVTLSGTAVTVGSPSQNNTPTMQTSNTNPSSYIYTGFWGPVKCRISDTAFATVYQTNFSTAGTNWYTLGSGNLNCTITSVSGTTQTLGTAVTIAANLGNPTGICSHTNNSFCVSYFTVSASGNPAGIRKAVAASVSGTVPTFGTPTSIDGSNVTIIKPSGVFSNNAVAFSTTKVWLPMYFVPAGESEYSSHFGVCTISGNTVTFVANSIIKVENSGYERFSFEFIDANTIAQYTTSIPNIQKYGLTASDIPYLLERISIISNLQNGGSLSNGLANFAINYTQGTNVAVGCSSTYLGGSSNITINTVKVNLI